MDRLIQLLKNAGGTVEVTRIVERPNLRVPTTEAIFRVYLDGKLYTLYAVCSATHTAASMVRELPTFPRPMGVS